MRFPSLARLAAAPVAAAVLLVTADPAQSQRKAPPKGEADQLLKPPPRPKKAALPPSKLPLELMPGERVALVGNSTAERMNLFGHFEALLHTRFPEKELVVRNFARPADAVEIRQRSADYTHLDDPLFAFGADTFLCFFGFNESFAGPAGVEKYKANYEKFLDEYAGKYPRDDANSSPRFVLVSPIAFEFPENKLLPSGVTENQNLKLYADATKAVADKRGLAFVDIFTPTVNAFTENRGLHATINGCHVHEAGDRLVGRLLDVGLFGSPTQVTDVEKFEKLRAAINDKSWTHLQDYRMLNGWYVYGGRRTYDTETFPREYRKIRNMAAVRDRYVWDIARNRTVPPKPDDSNTGELIVPPTRFGEPRQKYSENPEGGPTIRPPLDFIKTCTTAPGTEIKLFADEKKFPEIAKPVQLNFDNRGRLWVSCMPSYPLWRPGDPKPNDKLVILEDRDGDGTADKSTVFYDKLHCPTGFEFYDGGVLVIDQPRMLFLKDTDGDDKADVVIHLLDGWATDDTHHTAGAFEWNHNGRLHLLEGIATSTTLETPWGPHRSLNTGGCYVFDPRTFKVRQFALPGMANMWCYHFDQWGNGFPGDGTTPNMAWDTPLSGAQYFGRKGMNFLFGDRRDGGERPNIGSERLISRNLPDDLQGQFIYAAVITMNGMPRFTLNDDGAGFSGRRIRGDDGKYADLIRSTDKHFRPADPQIGPDGALWFGDWANPLVGHMQYSQRDPNRDHVHGRVYRLVGTGRPLLTPVTQVGKTVAEILEQFREPEWRTRYRARRELQDRPASEVLPAVSQWVAKLSPSDKDFDRLRCEALWVQEGHHAVEPGLLDQVLAAKTPEARAAAVKIATDERDYVSGAFARLKAASTDEHPRVRAEAARGLSFFPTTESVDALLAIAAGPTDYWLSYTTEAALAANEPTWRPGYFANTVAANNPAGKKVLAGILASNKAGAEAAPFLNQLLGTVKLPPEERQRAMARLAVLPGNPSKGRDVFVRNCTACHKVGNGEGQEFGPNLDKVATRMPQTKLVESMIDPNADVDPKYLSTRIVTLDGKSITGLVVAETPAEVTVFDGKEKKAVKKADIDERTTLKQSSMPEGMAGNMAPAEFIDLISYLSNLK